MSQTTPQQFTTSPTCGKCRRTSPTMEWAPDFIPFGPGRFIRKATIGEEGPGLLRLTCARCQYEWLMVIAPPVDPNAPKPGRRGSKEAASPATTT